MNNEQIKRRLTFIMADASHLLQHLNAGKGMDEFTGFADNGHTHLSNIQIAADLHDSESDAWNGARQVSMGISGKVSHDPKLARKYNALLEALGTEGLLHQIEQWMDDSDLKNIITDIENNIF
jgi:hypothetical protein